MALTSKTNTSKKKEDMNIPLNSPTFGSDEIESAIAVLKSKMVTMGENCFAFEKAFADFISGPSAERREIESVFVNSGSSANLLALFALTNPVIDELQSKLSFRRIRRGDEVIVPALTWSTSVWPIVQIGAIPVLVDVDPKTLQVPIENIEKAWSSKTAAVMAVHLLGNAAPVHEMKRLCQNREVALIEDTCESLGTTLRDDHVGTIGDVGTFSFFFSHHITTIEGGMVTSSHPDLCELFRCLRAHGWTRHLANRTQIESRYSELDPRFLFVNMGFNLRPNEINAVFGLHQLKKLPAFNKRRNEIATRWLEAFSQWIDSGELNPMVPTKEVGCTWFGFPVLLKSQGRRNAFRAHLELNGIETRPIVCGNLSRQPAFRFFEHRVSGDLRGADEVMDRGIYWGSHPLMSEKEVDYVIDVVNSFFNGGSAS